MSRRSERRRWLAAGLVLGLVSGGSCTTFDGLPLPPSDASADATAEAPTGTDTAAETTAGETSAPAPCPAPMSPSACLNCCKAGNAGGALLFAEAVWTCACTHGACTALCVPDGSVPSCTTLPSGALLDVSCYGCLLEQAATAPCHDNGQFSCPESGASAAGCVEYGACLATCVE